VADHLGGEIKQEKCGKKERKSEIIQNLPLSLMKTIF
jgi:hypothetical protein